MDAPVDTNREEWADDIDYSSLDWDAVVEQGRRNGELLWSGKTRGLFEFEPIAPIEGLPMGAIGLAVGSKGRAAFFSYIKQPKVVARLEGEGYRVISGPKAGADAKRIAFLHPSDTAKVLVELCSEA